MFASRAIWRILVATGFSPVAVVAVDRAVQLARAHGAALDLLHVFDVSAWHRLNGVFDAQRLAVDPPPDLATKQRLSDVAATLAADAGLEVREHFTTGKAAERIVACARERECALVVSGARADPGWLGLGGTALKVVFEPSCPVLTVRLNAAPLYERVLLAVELREALLQASQFALRLLPDAHHHALYAVDPAVDFDLWIDGPGEEHIRLPYEPMRARARAELGQLAGVSRERRGIRSRSKSWTTCARTPSSSALRHCPPTAWSWPPWRGCARRALAGEHGAACAPTHQPRLAGGAVTDVRWPRTAPQGRSAHQQHGHAASGHDPRGHRSHDQVAELAVSVRSHHQQIERAAVGQP